MSEDFNKLQLVVTSLRKKSFLHGWHFRVEIEPAKTDSSVTPFPKDFDLYVKDITYDPIEITTETEVLGSHTFTWPVSVAPVTITMTMRDDTDLTVRKWFQSLTDRIIDDDGLVGSMETIELKLKKFHVKNAPAGDSETESFDEWYVIPTKLGEITESREEGGNVEFPIVFVQSRTTRPPTKTT